VLPGVRFAVDGYVNFCRLATPLEAVAASLTEMFAPDLMETRIAAFEKHYPWIDPPGSPTSRSASGRGGRTASRR